MGAGKTGRWLCSEWLGPDARPDMLILGKSISGGAYPASYILGMNEVMSVVSPYTLGGTFTHTPMGLACTVAAMKIIDDEGLVARALNLGNRFIERTKEWPKKYACIEYTTARGADIFIAVTEGDGTGRRYSALAMHKGLLTHPTKGSVRMSLPLNIPDEDFEKGLDILEECAKELPFYTRIAGGVHETFPNMDR